MDPVAPATQMSLELHAPRLGQRDPWLLSGLIALGFMALCAWYIWVPSKIVFDELHYTRALRHLIALDKPFNREHPMVGKEMLAASVLLFGDNPIGWRAFSVLAGGITLLSAMRATWWASLSRASTILAGLLLASGFMLFVISRIAMLDPFMLVFAWLALWALAWALRHPRGGRPALIWAGLCMGLSFGSKWNVAPLLVLPLLTFAVVRLRNAGWRGLWRSRAAPLPGISLPEAVLWLAILPLVTYFASFWPAYLLHEKPTTFSQIFQYQADMLRLQDSVVKPHNYMSRWWQWVLNLRPIWFFYQNWDGAQRGILMIGNPFTMLAGLPALAVCLYRGVFRGDRAMLAAFAGWFATLIMWVVSPKPVQFFYHYLLPQTFLLIALALVLGRWWDRGEKWPAIATTIVSVGLFAWFYPILSAQPLWSKGAFAFWMWSPTWR